MDDATTLPTRLAGRRLRRATILILTAVATAWLPGLATHAACAAPTGDLTTTDVSFSSADGTILHGTVVAARGGHPPRPAMALVHGGGPGPRAWLRQEAEAFARAGTVTLIYDKRTEGYSLTDRSYTRLADDALAAVRLLRAQPGVDPARIGLWGLSEGGWVAPLAAATSGEVAFVITVGASGVPPARQEAWGKANRLREAGVSGSMARVYPATVVRLAADAGAFPEADHDPVPVLRRLRQPVLAIWGEHDTVSPPAESLSIFADALGRGGNPHHTLRVLRNGDHAGYLASEGGFEIHNWTTTAGQFAPGYIELVGSWVQSLADGPPPTSADPQPAQATSSIPLRPMSWYESAPAQLAALGILAVGFTSYPLTGLVLRLAGRRQVPPAARAARCLTLAGLTTVLGWLGYTATMLLSTETIIGPVILGRTLPWLVLQTLSLGTVTAAIATAAGWWRATTRSAGGTRAAARLGVPLTAAAVFLPWALYWGLLLP
jgi:pimeloyl-ACP methyl ester carboxylesterase